MEMNPFILQFGVVKERVLDVVNYGLLKNP